MAYRRSIAIRSNLIARRVNPSFSYVVRDDSDSCKHEDLSQQRTDVLLQRRLFGGSTANASLGFGGDRYCLPYSIPSRMGFGFSRHMSTSVGETSDKIGVITDVVGAFADSTVKTVTSQAPGLSEVAIAGSNLADSTMETATSQAPVLSEVAIAAADSWYPVAALQYVIDGVHCFTGLDWWASIAFTTLLIRGATIPFLIHQLKATTKLAIIRPKMEEFQEEMKSKGSNPDAVYENKRKMDLLFKEHGVTPWTPMKGLLIQGPLFVSFFLGITNMAEKVPSFKDGGVLWFQDLSTPDSLYILPVMAGLAFLIQVECNMQEGLEGNPMGGTMKKVMRGLAFLTVPFTMNFPKAVFFYWITNNFFSLVYGTIIKRPAVKKYLNIPDIPKPPPGSTPKPAFSLSDAYKNYKDMFQKHAPVPVASPEPPKLLMDKSKLLMDKPSAAINQKLAALEKQVKGRRKNKRR